MERKEQNLLRGKEVEEWEARNQLNSARYSPFSKRTQMSGQDKRPEAVEDKKTVILLN